MRLAVKAEHRQLELFVEIELNVFARLRIATHAVFRAVKGNQFHTGRGLEPLDDAVKIVIHAGWIRYESDTLSFDEIGFLLEQNFDAEFDGRVIGVGHRIKSEEKQSGNYEPRMNTDEHGCGRNGMLNGFAGTKSAVW